MVVVALIDYRRLESVAVLLYCALVFALLVVLSPLEPCTRFAALVLARLHPDPALGVRRPRSDHHRGHVLLTPKRGRPGLARRDPCAHPGRHPIVLVMAQPDLGTASS